MEITLELSKSFGMSPFDVMAQNTDDVITLVNHFIEKASVPDMTLDEEKANDESFFDGM